MPSSELKANICTAVCALKSVSLLNHHHLSMYLKARAASCCERFFFGRPFHNNASFALFLPLGVDGGGGVGGAGFYCYCSMLSAQARPHMWMWQGTISGFRDVDIATSQITTALISAKIMPKRLFFFFFWNKFSTSDVSCSCPLCSIGSYFGEAWVLLSNLLSRLQMKVSGGATHEKLQSPFWSGQIVLTRLKKEYFVHRLKLCLL